MADCNLVCTNCEETTKYSKDGILSINTEDMQPGIQNTLADVIDSNCSKCGKRRITDMWSPRNENLLIFSFSKPVDINLKKKEIFWGHDLYYKSHISQRRNSESLYYQAYFTNNQNIYFQAANKEIINTDYGLQKDVKTNSL